MKKKSAPKKKTTPLKTSTKKKVPKKKASPKKPVKKPVTKKADSKVNTGNKRGRKPLYGSHVKPRLAEVTAWAQDGKTEVEMCDELGIDVSTFGKYKNQYIELIEAIKKGKIVAVATMKKSLFKSGTGYEYEETKVVKTEGEPGRVERTTKQVAPNPTSIIFYLTNRDSENWQHVRNIKHSGSETRTTFDFSGMTDDELNKENEKYGHPAKSD